MYLICGREAGQWAAGLPCVGRVLVRTCTQHQPRSSMGDSLGTYGSQARCAVRSPPADTARPRPPLSPCLPFPSPSLPLALTCRVKFWIIKNYKSPQHKQVGPHSPRRAPSKAHPLSCGSGQLQAARKGGGGGGEASLPSKHHCGERGAVTWLRQCALGPRRWR
jgi:hypothetical protein